MSSINFFDEDSYEQFQNINDMFLMEGANIYDPDETEDDDSDLYDDDQHQDFENTEEDLDRDVPEYNEDELDDDDPNFYFDNDDDGSTPDREDD